MRARRYDKVVAAVRGSMGMWLLVLVLPVLMVVAGIGSVRGFRVSDLVFGIEERRGGTLAEGVLTARRGKKRRKGTKALLRQVALHMSKMEGGERIGGFPGFEPPEDDEEYREKIKNRAYTAEEADTWLKEINDFLRQIIKRHPNQSLEEILRTEGLTEKQVKDFLDALREVHVITDGMKGRGVSVEAVETFTTLMKDLGVVSWY